MNNFNCNYNNNNRSNDDRNQTIVGYLTGVEFGYYSIRVILNFDKPKPTNSEAADNNVKSKAYTLPAETEGLDKIDWYFGAKYAISGFVSTTQDDIGYVHMGKHIKIMHVPDDTPITPPVLTARRDNELITKSIEQYKTTDDWLKPHGAAEQTLTGYITGACHTGEYTYFHPNATKVHIAFYSTPEERKELVDKGFVPEFEMHISDYYLGAKEIKNALTETYGNWDYGIERGEIKVKVTFTGYAMRKKDEHAIDANGNFYTREWFEMIPYGIKLASEEDELIPAKMPRKVRRDGDPSEAYIRQMI